ncbi:hypothetical protein MUB24_00715 [Lederbergia sp. NSJ-179]|uniref:YphA family membrane protein n=1 Tax=Lederbergia sp. NSJ-179 TaxID=2931402 RepID=UPI001FD367AA|nr:hypothetical protein [Lederbergia sp. NSJ-179]MCJ7839449.1 hypothetical protein [Lederbergia sp. NSJ-179]
MDKRFMNIWTTDGLNFVFLSHNERGGVPMTGIIFLLFVWILWIFATFLMDKQETYRWATALFALVLIICLPLRLSFNGLLMSGPCLIVLMICYLVAVKLPFKKQIFLLISFLSLILGYTGFQLLELYDPIMIIIDRKILLSFILFVVSYFIYPSSLLERILFICLGILQGDLLFAIILAKWNIPYLIGSLETFDVLSITIFTIMLSYLVSRAFTFVKITKNKKVLH